jgi:(p)ppGpp synthase/HD superfamily hydrolase
VVDAALTTGFVCGLPKSEAALKYARRMHAGQRRQLDGAPFIEHPLEVAAILHDAGATDHVIAAGILHDTLEKTDATPAVLSRRFGAQVAKLVRAVTEDEQVKGYAHRKAALREQVAHAGPEALMLFAADKLSKVRELRRGPVKQTQVRRRRLRHYYHCLGLLQEQLPDSALVSALKAELDALPDPPPRRAAPAKAG